MIIIKTALVFITLLALGLFFALRYKKANDKVIINELDSIDIESKLERDFTDIDIEKKFIDNENRKLDELLKKDKI